MEIICGKCWGVDDLLPTTTGMLTLILFHDDCCMRGGGLEKRKIVITNDDQLNIRGSGMLAWPGASMFAKLYDMTWQLTGSAVRTPS
jgi:hypothetical protein